MLSREIADQKEEELRQRINQLSGPQRKLFYQLSKERIKDPDTYATLNYFFIAGLHHFYLGEWMRGSINLLVFALGSICLIFHDKFLWVGIALIAAVSLVELYALFRSQVIVKSKNNDIMEKILNEIQ